LIPILPADNAGTLHDKLMVAGATLLVTTVKGLADGTLKEIPQGDIAVNELKHAPKIFKENLAINWNKAVGDIDNFVRGMSPYPGAFTMLGDKTLKIYSSDYRLESHNETTGSHQTDHSTYLRFAAADGWLYAEEVQLEGKKRMDVTDFLRGFRGI